MTIKKFGHCCLLIKTGGLTILTDPGSFTTEQNQVKGIDVILITHEHGDHLHTDSVKAILKNNPQAKIFTNSGVGKKLDEIGAVYTVLEGTATTNVGKVAFEAFDCKHEEIFEDIGQVQNTGYLVDNKLFFPGDSFGKIGKNVEVLALPVSGPWCKIPDALRYAIALKPKRVFPVHDGGLVPEALAFLYRVPSMIFQQKSIEFVPMHAGDEKEF